jgi:uncharacterized membrane protein (UPF0136 family)
MGIYQFKGRLELESFGMWDSWAIWNLKAKTLTNEFLFADKVQIPHPDWAQKDYPIGLPVLHASIAILMGFWTQSISYLLQIVFHALIGYGIIKYFREKSSPWYFSFLALCFLLVNTYYLMIGSDLCAELILAVSLLYIYLGFLKFLEIQRPSRLDYLSYGAILALPILFKNEGLLISSFFLGIFIFTQLLERKSRIQSISFTLLPYGLVGLLLFLWKISNSEILPVDYKRSSISDLGTEIANRWPFVQSYLFEFHKSHTFYLFPIAIVSALATCKKSFIMIGIHLCSVIFFYNFIFLLSTRDISWHLSTAYTRIHSALIPVAIFLLCASFDYLVKKLYDKS